MALDFKQVRDQVKRLGEDAPWREEELKQQRDKALATFASYADEIEKMREKIARVVGQFEPNLRCALPVREPLNHRSPAPAPTLPATLIAADGSQIAPDRHAAVDYCLINVGAITACQGSPEPPVVTVKSRLMYGDQLYTPTGTLTSDAISMMRDLEERRDLVEMVRAAEPPVITFTDGPLELWGEANSKDSSDFKGNLETYKAALRELHGLGATTAGYVDKPAGNLVLRLLETMITPEDLLPDLRKRHPLRPVTDIFLYRRLLEPGERSAVFALQAYSARHYTGPLALHFFYLNVGRPGHPSLARVEIPAWVTENSALLDGLHGTLVAQSKILGARPYPYLLHRAHEAAVVSFQEKDQVTQMILVELRRRGIEPGEESNKQYSKNLEGRTHYGR